MICTFDQITNIIKNNPNKPLIEIGKEQAEVLMLNIQGYGMANALKQNSYFENNDVYAERNKDAISNKDMFGRLFQREEMVFTAQGGASVFSGLSETQTQEMNAMLSDIRYDINLRQWVKTFALQAFRCDPMGVIFMEQTLDGKKAYPTYKSISGVYDYLPNGRKLEYICFKLKVSDAIFFGVQDETLKEAKADGETMYFRFVDDAYDAIYKLEGDQVIVAPMNKGIKAQVKNPWQKTPAFIASNIMEWDAPAKFLSPIYLLLELAGCFMKDRSIRDLAKKYSGFAKAIEPLLMCGTCDGTGQLSSGACPDCTPEGAEVGIGFKLKTKVADVARFPLSALAEGFDYKKIFGYASPDIEVWNKQDTSLNDLENLINDGYWGTDNRARTSGVDMGDKSVEETATKTLANIQPIYARLNLTADWAQQTENLIATFVGQHKFKTDFKKSSITYGRYYILETPEDLIEQYTDQRSKGAPQLTLFDTLRKYYHSLYQTNPIQLVIKTKLINVEPLVHSTIQQAQLMNISKSDYMCKVYFSEWLATKTDDYLYGTLEEALRADLLTYATKKATEVESNPFQEPIEPKEPVTGTKAKKPATTK